ncbi:bifunctional UDP-N-acetylglucosamine diphosphorylase/glucosamine-1-phosphate N-acetyltransferase GlmU [Nakamurella aerolata]|nr:bifunctional UDP-N-acetylglucosamine diphosphorylase/glucosamine-1-phosphate N-acetyltransferase GlmU [Nakamurella aerolata]
MSQPTAAASPVVSAVIVLAAGAGTRMRSALPKVLHPIAGRPLVWHALRAAAGLSPERLVAVLGNGREQVAEFLRGAADLPPVIEAVQDQQLGTGHAVACALDALRGNGFEPAGTVIVSYGDVPLLTTDTLAALAADHAAAGNAVTVLTATVGDPTGYGRITRDADGGLAGIVEHKDATDAQRGITEINSGVYAFDGAVLAELLPRIGSANAQGEVYLTDAVALAKADGRNVGTSHADDPIETEGVNDRVQLAQLSAVLRDRIVQQHQRAGVTFLDPASAWVHTDVQIGQDTSIGPGVQLEAGSQIGSGVRIGPDVTLSNCRVGDGAQVVRAHCLDSDIGAGATVGPYSYLRQRAVLAAGSKVGTFVELKKTQVGAGAKVPHQTYLGDATVGAGSNVGAGVITANYDGTSKFETHIGAASFVGSNVTLVAPVTLADGSYVATGSTVTDDVPPGALAVARGRQYNSDGWVLRKHPGTAMDRAARSAGAVDRDRTDPGTGSGLGGAGAGAGPDATTDAITDATGREDNRG